MNSDRKKTIIAGILYFIGTIAGILSVSSVIDASDYLQKASADANQVILAALFQFIWTIAFLGFAIALYPILRKHMESLATGFLSFRIIAAALNIIGFIIILLILWLSQEFVKSGTTDSSYYQTLGDLLRSARDLVNHIAMILTSSIGGLMFYYLLYKTKLVQRWLSLWGILGCLITVIACFLLLFDIIDIITITYFLLFLPLIILEVVLAIRFIARGFDSSEIDSVSKKE